MITAFSSRSGLRTGRGEKTKGLLEDSRAVPPRGSAKAADDPHNIPTATRMRHFKSLRHMHLKHAYARSIFCLERAPSGAASRVAPIIRLSDVQKCEATKPIASAGR